MNKLPRVGVGVLIFNEHNQVLLGKRIDGHGSGCWAPAGGHLEFGESLEQCAMREVLEETGLKITEPQFLALMNDVFVQEEKHYVSIFMRADYPKEQEVQNTEPHKTETWKWFGWNQLPPNLFLPLQQFKDQQCYGALFSATP
jgi:8-oxo-dGTP diphosphatase